MLHFFNVFQNVFWGKGATKYHLTKISPELHENEEMLARGGASPAPPPRSTTATTTFYVE